MTKILIVDDSVVASRLIAKVFEFPNSRFELDFANDGAQGLEKIETTKPELVITDLEMPNVNGLELVSTTKERHPLTPVILVTSKGSEEIAAEALRNGAASYVPKVSIETALLDVVSGILDIYKPSQAAMSHWGVRNVQIQIVEEGSYDEARRILQSRLHHAHCKAMYRAIRPKDWSA